MSEPEQALAHLDTELHFRVEHSTTDGAVRLMDEHDEPVAQVVQFLSAIR